MQIWPQEILGKIFSNMNIYEKFPFIFKSSYSNSPFTQIFIDATKFIVHIARIVSFVNDSKFFSIKCRNVGKYFCFSEHVFF